VQPRSKKIKSKIGIGIPRSQSKMYPVAPACLILFIKCMFVLSLERFTSSQFPFGVLPWICPVSFGAGPEVPHLSLRQTLGRCRLIDRHFCFSLPFTSFQPPLNCSLFISITSSHTEPKSDASRASGELKEYYARKSGQTSR
jgi:hypothetical protein